jgi:DNA gyrase subunit A
MLIIDPNFELFTLTSLGYGKRTKIDDYRLQSRGGKGIKAGIFNEKTGYLVSLKPVTDDNDIMIITTGRKGWTREMMGRCYWRPLPACRRLRRSYP